MPYNSELEYGSVTLTKEQAVALVLAAADSLRYGKSHDEVSRLRLVAAVAALNGEFLLGVEKSGG